MKLSNNQKALIYTMLFWVILGGAVCIVTIAPIVGVGVLVVLVVGWLSYLVYLMFGGDT